MTRENYINKFVQICQEHVKLTQSKNSDYAAADNAFKNFQLIEYLTDGKVSTAAGLLVRMSDKLQRIANLLSKPADVADESIIDSCDDLAVYSKILRIVLEDRGAVGAAGKGPAKIIPFPTGLDAPTPQTAEEAYQLLMKRYEEVGSSGLSPLEREQLKSLIEIKLRSSANAGAQE